MGHEVDKQGGRKWVLGSIGEQKNDRDIENGKSHTVFQPQYVIHQKSLTEKSKSLYVNSKGIQKITELSNKGK